MLALLAGAAAFSPPPVFTDTLPAEAAGTVRSFADALNASMTMAGGTPLEQAMPLNEQEEGQEQSWLWGGEEREWFGRSDSVQQFLVWNEEGEEGDEGEGTFGEEGRMWEGGSCAGDVKEKARATAVAEFLEAEDGGEAEVCLA